MPEPKYQVGQQEGAKAMQDGQDQKALRYFQGDSCELCEFEPGKAMCGESGPTSLICTRRRDHDNDHAACGTFKDQHPIKTWPTSDAPNKEH